MPFSEEFFSFRLPTEYRVVGWWMMVNVEQLLEKMLCQMYLAFLMELIISAMIMQLTFIYGVEVVVRR